MSHFPDLGAFVGVERCVSRVFGELCTDAPLEHLLVALLEPCGHMLQFLFLRSESEQSLRYALFQWNRMDSLFELSEQPLNPPKSPSREVLERDLSRRKVLLRPAGILELWAVVVVQRVELGRRLVSGDNHRSTRRPSSRPSRGQGHCRWRRWPLCSSY